MLNLAQAKACKKFGNRAVLTSLLSHVVDAFSSDISPKRFNSVWNYSIILPDTILEIKKTLILADAEALAESGGKTCYLKLPGTLKICMSNLESQQSYIDTKQNNATRGARDKLFLTGHCYPRLLILLRLQVR